MFQRHKLGYDWLLKSEGIKINPHLSLMPPVTWKLNFAILQQYHITTECECSIHGIWAKSSQPTGFVRQQESHSILQNVLTFFSLKKRENHVWQGTLLNIQCNISIDFTWHPTDTLEKYGFSITPWLYEISIQCGKLQI